MQKGRINGNLERRKFIKVAASVTASSALMGSAAGLVSKNNFAGIEVIGTGAEVRPGKDTLVEYKIRNDQGKEASGISLVLGPSLEGWNRKNAVNSSGQILKRKSGGKEPYFAGWQWDSIAAGESVKASYHLTVPTGAEPGDYTVFAEVSSRGGNSKVAQVTSPPATTQTPADSVTAAETETTETTSSTPDTKTSSTETPAQRTTETETETESPETTTSPLPGTTTTIETTPTTTSETTTATSTTTTSTTTSALSGEDGGEVVVSGRVLGPNDEADYDDLIIHEQEKVGRMSESITKAVTDDDGSFDYSIKSGKPHSISYYHTQDSYTIVQPIDPKPDIYYLEELQPTESRDLGTFELPLAYPVTVTIIDESENPVQAAAVYVVHKFNGSGTGWKGYTGTDGQLFPDWDSGAVDLRGDCSVEVSPPENSARFVNKTYEREFTVSSPKSIEITLEEKDTITDAATDTRKSKDIITDTKTDTKTPPTTTPSEPAGGSEVSTTPTTTTTTITVEGGTSPAPSDLQFSQGNKRIVDTGDDQYYLIDQIPDIDPNRVAITTLDYELVDESIAKDVIALDFFRDALFTMNWEREAEDLLELWSRSMSLKNAGLFLDIGWDLTEILIYVSAGINNAAVDSAKDAALEAISWQLREINQPYRETFSKFTACLASNSLIEERVNDITSYDDLSSRAIHYIEETMNLNETLSKRSSPSENINDAWEDMFNSLSEESEYSSELEAAINGSQLFLAIANPPDQQEMISSSIGSIEDVVKTKTTIHVIEQDYAYMRIDVVRKLRNLRAKFDQDEGTIGELHFYNECVKTNFQMNALFYAAIAEYWKKISEHPANLLWDVLVQADEKAARYAELAENMKQTIYDTQNIRGMGWRVVEDRLESSVNVETEKGGSN